MITRYGLVAGAVFFLGSVIVVGAVAQNCGGPGQAACVSSTAVRPLPPASISSLVISVGVPACVLATPPCFTVDVRLVPNAPTPASAATRSMDHVPRACGNPGMPSCP